MINFSEFEKIGKELYPKFAEFEHRLKNNWNKLLFEINDNFLDSKNILKDNEYWDWFAYDNQLEWFGYIPDNVAKNPFIVELGLKNEIRQKENISHSERVGRLNLGFYVQLLKFENITTICQAWDDKFKPDNRTWADNILEKYIFPNYETFNDRFFLMKNYIDIENKTYYYDYYAECFMIQNLRNDFCHFRFDISKLKETKELLDKYISILTIKTLTRSQNLQV